MPINSLGRSIFNNNDIYLNLADSRFKVDIPVKNSFMMGRLIPIGYPIEVVKNDKFSLSLAGLVRTGSAMIAPILDDMYLDVFSFWVPKRILWNQMAQFLGENDSTAWTQATELEEPTFDYYGQIDSDGNYGASGIALGNYLLAPHFGLPYNTVGSYGGESHSRAIKIRALEFRGYYALWNQYFRFTEWQRPVLWSKENDGSQGEFGYCLDTFDIVDTGGSTKLKEFSIGDSNTDASYALLMPVNCFYDSFMSIKPAPQFGEAVDIFGDVNTLFPVGFIPLQDGTASGGVGIDAVLNGESVTKGEFEQASVRTAFNVVGGPLLADGRSLSLEVSKLRSAVLLQNFKQAIGRTDARVDSILQLLFGSGKSGFEDDRPRLLNHYRQRIGVNQIVATADSSNSSASSHLGETGAYSITALQCDLVNYRFSEPGFIYTLACVRQVNTYGQGVPEQFLRYNFWDQYNPFIDKIGMVPFKAVYVNAASEEDLILGYQEAHYGYKSNRGIVVGALNPDIADSYNFWTLAKVLPAFSTAAGIGPGTFIQGPSDLDRALLANHDVAPQFIGDFRILGTSDRKMSVHGDSLVMGMRL